MRSAGTTSTATQSIRSSSDAMPRSDFSGDLYITGDAGRDGLLNRDPNALLIGMLLDQQVPLEWAFAGPATLQERLGHLDPARIAALGDDEFVAVCATKPAIHRFPASMGRRIQALCATIVDDYDGDATRLWTSAADADDLLRRLRALPGFGAEKSKIFIALLAKRFGVQPSGWEQVAGTFADNAPRTIADVFDADSLAAVRERKRLQRSRGLDKQDRPTAPR